MNATTYYRFHWLDCPEFSAQNAWSALWGAERSEDGSQTRCGCCEGDGQCVACCGDCQYCDGTGWQDACEGYSCFENPAELVEYFAVRGIPADDDGSVIAFTGRLVGNGADGEQLAVPVEIVETMTWTRFAANVTA